MKPNGKCFAKKCKDCNWYQSWDMEDSKTGLRRTEHKCSIQVLITEIPFIRGSIDGLQGGVNEARNRTYETQEFLKVVFNGNTKQIEGEYEDT